MDLKLVMGSVTIMTTYVHIYALVARVYGDCFLGDSDLRGFKKVCLNERLTSEL